MKETKGAKLEDSKLEKVTGGGICGTNDNGNINNCYNTGDVSGNTDVGGVCGGICGGNNGSVSGDTSGGIVGSKKPE